MDLRIREIARQAGLGNLNAAKQLVRLLERAGAQDSEGSIIELAKETLHSYNSDVSDVGSNLFYAADRGADLATLILDYFGIIAKPSGPDIMECCGRFENEGHHPECPQHEIDMGYEELEDD